MEPENNAPASPKTVFFLTKKMYISRALLDSFKAKGRGSRGSSWVDMYEDDAPLMLFTCEPKDSLLFFTNSGWVFSKRAEEMCHERGWVPMKSEVRLEEGERIVAAIPLKESDYQDPNSYLFFATKLGMIKKTAIDLFRKINVNGKAAMVVNEGDELRFAIKIYENSTVCLASSGGKMVKFSSASKVLDLKTNRELDNFLPSGRTAKGRCGINLRTNDSRYKNNVVVSASSSSEGNLILSISERGIGKVSDPEEFRKTTVGKKVGVNAQKITERTGKLVACAYVNENDEILLMTSHNKINRFRVGELKVQGWNTSGVILMKLEENERIVYYTKNCGSSFDH